jgi:Gas vesicle protein K/Gas vesicle protein
MTSSARRNANAIQKIEMGSDGAQLQNGLAKLVLTVIEVVRQVMERQALKRVEAGTLTDAEVEKLGLAFMELNRKVKEMSRDMGVKPEELKAGLSSLIRSSDTGLETGSLVDLLDRLLDKNVVVAGQVKISVAEVDLVGLDLFAMLYPIYGNGRVKAPAEWKTA